MVVSRTVVVVVEPSRGTADARRLTRRNLILAGCADIAVVQGIVVVSRTVVVVVEPSHGTASARRLTRRILILAGCADIAVG